MRLATLICLLAAFRCADAVPIVLSPGYSVTLVASGLGSATGVAIDPTGDIFVSDYRDVGPSSVYKVGATTGTVQTYATGFAYSTDLAFDSSGRLFVLSGSGSPRDVYQVFADGSRSLYLTGLSFSVGLEPTADGGLVVGNSGDGTVTKIAPDGASSTYLSGYGGPNGPFGLAYDSLGNLYFVQHGSGQVFMRDPAGLVSLLATLTPFGPTFLDVGADGSVYVSDSQSASIHRIQGGIVSTFATGFAGKAGAPSIGPSDLEFDAFGNLYVADADLLWKISPVAAAPVPTTLALLGLGLAGLRFRRRERQPS